MIKNFSLFHETFVPKKIASREDSIYGRKIAAEKIEKEKIIQPIKSMIENNPDEYVKIITHKLMHDTLDWDPKYRKGCNAKNIKKWLIGDNKDGYMYSNDVEILLPEQVFATDFFEWYDD